MAKANYDKQKLSQLKRDLRSDMQSEGLGDAEAFDIAEFVLMDEEGLEEYLNSIGIKDAQGYMADQIV